MFGSSKTYYFMLVIGAAEEVKSVIEIVESLGGADNLRFTSYELLNDQTALFRYSDRNAEPRLEQIREFSKRFESLQFISLQASELLKFMNGHVHDLAKDEAN